MVLGDIGSEWGGTGWYLVKLGQYGAVLVGFLVVLGQYGAVLVGTWWYKVNMERYLLVSWWYPVSRWWHWLVLDGTGSV